MARDRCPYLAPCLLRQLVHSRVCDIDHREGDLLALVEKVVAPLRLLLTLEDCRVWLNGGPDHQLKQLVQGAALQARSVAMPPYYSPLPITTTVVTLARELRLRTLEYTDPIISWRQFTWSRKRSAYHVVVCTCYELSEYCPYSDHNGCQFFHYGSKPDFENGCFCYCRHSTLSPSCRCWVAPGPALFLVCRTVLRDVDSSSSRETASSLVTTMYHALNGSH